MLGSHTHRSRNGSAASFPRASVIVDACFRLIVDAETASSKTCLAGVQAPVVNVAQPPTISPKRALALDLAGAVHHAVEDRVAVSLPAGTPVAGDSGVDTDDLIDRLDQL